MSINNFIPEIWSKQLNVSLQKALVYGQIANRNWEGEIKQQGDIVRINSIGPITTFAVTKNTDITDPETLDDAQTTLQITQSRGFNFQVDDADAIQGNVALMGNAMQEAAYALADDVDQYIASFYTDVPAGNTLGSDDSPISITKTNAYDYLVDLGTILSDAKVPKIGRFAVVPPWFHGKLQKDSRFYSAANYGSNAALINGEIGKAAGFTLLESHNVPNTASAKYKIMAGTTKALTFANQASKTEAYRPEKRFADAVKGLTLYGAKMVYPAAMALLIASSGSDA